MSKLVKFDVGDGSTVFIEVEDVTTDGEIEPCARTEDRIAYKARQKFDDALDNITPMVKVIKQKLGGLREPADEVEVKFGVKLSGEIGAIVTKYGGEMNYEITLKWKNE